MFINKLRGIWYKLEGIDSLDINESLITGYIDFQDGYRLPCTISSYNEVESGTYVEVEGYIQTVKISDKLFSFFYSISIKELLSFPECTFRNDYVLEGKLITDEYERINEHVGNLYLKFKVFYSTYHEFNTVVHGLAENDLARILYRLYGNVKLLGSIMCMGGPITFHLTKILSVNGVVFEGLGKLDSKSLRTLRNIHH